MEQACEKGDEREKESNKEKEEKEKIKRSKGVGKEWSKKGRGVTNGME